MRKVASLLDNYEGITRVQKMYFAYAYKASSSVDTRLSSELHLDLQSIFYQPRTLYKVGNLVMNIKVLMSYLF